MLYIPQLLQCLIHCADLSNPAKEEELAVNWSHRIMQETFQQGDEERSRDIPVNPLGDRDQVSVAKCQVYIAMHCSVKCEPLCLAKSIRIIPTFTHIHISTVYTGTVRMRVLPWTLEHVSAYTDPVHVACHCE